MKKMEGFTLIELMIVIIIIAILTAITLPSYQAYVRKSQEAKVESQILFLAEQLERHKARNFNYKNFTGTANKTYNYLMSSDGLKCKSLQSSKINFKCADGSESW